MAEAALARLPDAAREEALLRGAERLSTQNRRRRVAQVLALQIALGVGLLVLWQFASGRWVDQLFFSAPDKIVSALIRIIANGTLWWQLQTTLLEMVSGYVIGVAAGVGVAFLVASLPFGEPIVRPAMLLAFATPKVALAPLIIIWFGIGLLPKIILAAGLVFFIVYFNTLVGIASTSPGMIATLRVMGATRWDLMRKAILQQSFPYILTSMRITLPAALIGAIIGEFVSSNRGIGYLIAAASSRYDTAQVFAAIFGLLAFVLVLNTGISALERVILRWQPADRMRPS